MFCTVFNLYSLQQSGQGSDFPAGTLLWDCTLLSKWLLPSLPIFYFSVTSRSLMLQVLMLCSGLPVTMFEFLDGIFSFEGQERSILLLPWRQCLLSKGGETWIFFLLM